MMWSLYAVLRESFGPLALDRRDPFAVVPLTVGGSGEVSLCHGIGSALRRAVDVARVGNGAAICSVMPSHEIAPLVLRAEMEAEGEARAIVDREHLAAAAARAVNLPMWIDESVRTARNLRARLGKLDAEWTTYSEAGERLRRIALVVLQGWPPEEVSRGARAQALREIALKMNVAVLVC